MGPVLQLGIRAGLLIVVIDLLTFGLLQAAPDDENLKTFADTANIVANCVVLWMVAFHLGRETRLVRAAAEAGVLAGAIAGVAGVLTLAVWPTALLGELTVVTAISHIAENVVLAGVLSIVAGWLGKKAPARQ